MSEKKYDFFFIALTHDLREEVISDLEKYLNEDQSYIISLETSATSHKDVSGEHYHFAVENFTNYHNYCKNIIKRKYGLKGKATKGLHGNQYGKVNQVRDQEKFLQYILKEGNIDNIIYKKIDLKIIQEYMQRSYKKEDRRSFYDNLMNYLVTLQLTFVNNHNIDFQKLEMHIIRFISEGGADTKMSVTRSKVKSYATAFIMYYLTPNMITNDDEEFIDIDLLRWNYIMRL